MSSKKIKPHLQKSVIALYAEKAKIPDSNDLECMTISLRHRDRSQGQTFSDWEEKGVLAEAIETLWNYSLQPLKSQFNDRFKIYTSFPPNDKTMFKHPDQVPQDAKWASMHVSGRKCLIGHIYQKTFFLVFLDIDHKFWDAPLRNT